MQTHCNLKSKEFYTWITLRYSFGRIPEEIYVHKEKQPLAI